MILEWLGQSMGHWKREQAFWSLFSLEEFFAQPRYEGENGLVLLQSEVQSFFDPPWEVLYSLRSGYGVDWVESGETGGGEREELGLVRKMTKEC